MYMSGKTYIYVYVILLSIGCSGNNMKICIGKLLYLNYRLVHTILSNSYIDELQPLFEIDPLLLRLFVKVVALDEIHLLIGKVPTSILLMRLAEESTEGNQVIYQYMKMLQCVY